MHKLIQLVLVLLFLGFLPACVIEVNDDDGIGPGNCIDGFGSVNTFDLNIGNFSGINLRIPADVYLTQGSVQRVEIEAQSNIVSEIETDVRSGIWYIETDRCISDFDPINIYITIPDIRHISMDGVGHIFGQNTFVSNELELRITGSGDMNLDVEADEIDIRLTGIGDVDLRGFTDFLDVTISGAGDLEAFDCTVEDAEVDITGVGNAEVYVDSSLKVFISGSGNVYYKGNPTLDINITGIGNVIDRN